MAHVGNVLTGSATDTGTQRWAFPFTSDVPAGRFLVATIGFRVDEDDSIGPELLLIEDARGNAWTEAARRHDSDRTTTFIAYAFVDSHLSEGDGLTFVADSVRPQVVVSVESFTDYIQDSPVDVVVNSGGIDGIPTRSSDLFTTSETNELLFFGTTQGLVGAPTFSPESTGFVASDVTSCAASVEIAQEIHCVSAWKYQDTIWSNTRFQYALSGATSDQECVVSFKLAAPGDFYDVRVDWSNDGSFAEADDDVSSRVLARDPISIRRGRDQARSLSPLAIGSASLLLNNESRDYSPENISSPLYGKIKPARPIRVRARRGDATYVLFRGYTDEFDVLPNLEDRSVSVTALDGLALLRDVRLSTRVRESLRTGDAIHAVLDEVGWPENLRDIDRGATTIRFWWEEGTDAFDAVQRIVNSEGPSALVAIGQSGEFIFRDRHHRLTRAASTTSQATFSDTGTEPLFSPPLVYDAGWRDIVNSVTLSVQERQEAPMRELVWESTALVSVASGETKEVFVETSDPFNNARKPMEGIDYELLFGTVEVSLSRNSGQSTTIQVKGVGGAAQIRNLKLFANPITAASTVQIMAQDTTSIAQYGVKSYSDATDLPWAGKNDAEAIAALVLAQRGERLPIVSVRMTGDDSDRLTSMLGRDLSDRITIVDSETGLSRDFYIEQIEHTISEAGLRHETVFGCEALPLVPTDVFVLDVGELDVNHLGLVGLDTAANVFVLGDATQGQFGTGLFAH